MGAKKSRDTAAARYARPAADSTTRSASDDALPKDQDDPRLREWYHTIELGNGLLSRGRYDHRSIVDCYGLPESLEGKTALAWTCDGFWAFELERRGSQQVVAIDVERWGDFDFLPRIRNAMGQRS